MPKQIQEDLDLVLKKLLHMGGVVEETIDRALRALLDRDAAAAHAVVKSDAVIDELELDVEKKCLDILALRQPVAVDLRMVTMIMKVNSDLERIGDLAVNIAERALELSKVPALPFRPDVSKMAAVAKRMVRDSLNALVRSDEALALQVWEADDEADDLYRELIGEIILHMETHHERIGDALQLLNALRNLERIADHATNIAEDVIYLVHGRIVRHHMRDFAAAERHEKDAGGRRNGSD